MAVNTLSSAAGAKRETKALPWAAFTEVMLLAVLLAVLLVSYIWYWKGLFRGHTWLLLFLYFGIGTAAHLRRGDGLADLGFRRDTGWAAARLLVKWTAPVLVVILCATRSTWHFPSPDRMPGYLAWGYVWGLAQQYGLLCVFFAGLREIFPKRTLLPEVLSGFLFAVFHLPNPFLFAVTLIAGTLSAAVFRRAPNLWVMGFFHMSISLVLSKSLPETVTYGMKVGPKMILMF